MQLTKLILKNFRSHKNLTLNFNEGVTAILGPNGSGKSNIVEAIMFLLTGEGYSKTKQDMLTVGEVSGYAIGHWLIDGKEAVLERHLDSSKVAFKYDGTTYKKSVEVNEVWDKLFQIDKHIVQNVIISNQGEISLLFNGDQSSKEKLFQKIFMVPNTTKLRDVIWNSYIKTAPPEYPVKSEVELYSDLQCLEKIVELRQEQISTDYQLDNDEYAKLLVRENFLSSVKDSEIEVKRIKKDLESVDNQQQILQESRKPLENNLQLLPVDEYRKELLKLEAAEPLYLAKLKHASQLEKLQQPANAKPDSDALLAENQRLLELRAAAKTKAAAIDELEQKLDEYKKSGMSSGVCPTCGTQVDNIIKLMEHTDKELAQYRTSFDQLVTQGTALKSSLEIQNKNAENWNTYEREKARLTQLLGEYGELNYSKEDHELCKKVVARADELELKIKQIDEQLLALDRKREHVRAELVKLVHYDKEAAQFNSEVEEVAASIARHKQKAQELKNLELELAAKKQELKTIRKDYEDNKSYIEKNNLRTEYTSILNSIYDLFHTTQFPRALIQTYSSTVTEYMGEVLEEFNFPYSAKVNESFGIDVYNEQGLLMPSVSGGQEVMVGFSLRLALHNMFVGAFPFMIVDEGSYGLNGENTKKYFEVISKLNKTSKFKQVLVIDHNPELSEYVNNTINL